LFRVCKEQSVGNFAKRSCHGWLHR